MASFFIVPNIVIAFQTIVPKCDFKSNGIFFATFFNIQKKRQVIRDITFKRAIKELIPKLKKRRLKAMTLQEAIGQSQMLLSQK